MNVSVQERQPRWAVIDIGSNSVRLVVYDGPKEAPLSILNEKALCGLGDRVPETGDLRPEAVASALSVLARYKAILDATKPLNIITFATAAVRDAPNGQEFLDDVVGLGLEPTLITGDQEARYAALGVQSSAPEILRRPGGGLSGDIGGGSLELCHLDKGYEDQIGPGVSLPLGGLRLLTTFPDDLKGA